MDIRIIHKICDEDVSTRSFKQSAVRPLKWVIAVKRPQNSLNHGIGTSFAASKPTLGGLLAAILGIQPGGDSETARFRVNGARIGGFGFACVLGVLGGMTLRVQDVLAIPVKTQVDKWKEAGYPETEARRIVAFQKTNILSYEANGAKIEVAATEGKKGQEVGLFSGESDEDLCNELTLKKSEFTPEEQSKAMLKKYRRLHELDTTSKSAPVKKALNDIAVRMESQPANIQFEVLQSIGEIVCAN